MFISVMIVMAVSLFPIKSVRSMHTTAEPVLKKAVITFIMPEGDDKDTDTKVSVSVSSKFNNQFDLTLASRNDFAGTDTWEDPGGKEYTYELSAATGTKLSQISGDVKTRITINPNGNDTVKFNYRLILVFDDDDPNTPASELKQERENITLSQDNRTFSS
jgi:hypothetical protein